MVIKCTRKKKWHYCLAQKSIWMHEEPSDIESINKEHLLVVKPNTTLKVWAHFGLKSDGNGFTSKIQLRWRSQYVATATRLTDWCFCLRP